MIRETLFWSMPDNGDHFYYGTLKAYVDEQLEKCKNVILEIEIQER